MLTKVAYSTNCFGFYIPKILIPKLVKLKLNLEIFGYIEQLDNTYKKVDLDNNEQTYKRIRFTIENFGDIVKKDLIDSIDSIYFVKQFINSIKREDTDLIYLLEKYLDENIMFKDLKIVETTKPYKIVKTKLGFEKVISNYLV